jgi:hypothetical protein
MDRAIEEEHLRKAEAGIAQAIDRIERQRQLIERMAADGHDVTTATSMLQTMQETLDVMKQHRQAILKELAR